MLVRSEKAEFLLYSPARARVLHQAHFLTGENSAILLSMKADENQRLTQSSRSAGHSGSIL